MKKYFSLLVCCSILALSACVGTTSPRPEYTRPMVTPAPVKETPSAVTTTSAKIYMIAVDDGGKSGKMIGCNDSAVAVDVKFAGTTAPLNAALAELLQIKDQNYGESGLYNALYQSNFNLDDVSFDEGAVTIKLSGNLMMGGVCDAPRIDAQLKETALQFDSVKNVTILLNGKPLDELLSGKGE